jgi:adenylate kinase family enzyme
MWHTRAALASGCLERKVLDGPVLRRVAIIGTTGSGKTTLALQLAQRLDLCHVELDSLYWEADWQPVSRDHFLERVAQALGPEAWVADGNYGQARDLIWGSADTLIWLDMPLLLALWRVISRTLRRIAAREVLWNGNRETIGNALLSRDGLVLYLFKSRRQHKKNYPLAFHTTRVCASQRYPPELSAAGLTLARERPSGGAQER